MIPVEARSTYTEVPPLPRLIYPKLVTLVVVSKGGIVLDLGGLALRFSFQPWNVTH